MSNKIKSEEYKVESPKLKQVEILDSDLQLIDRVIQDFAPEILFWYQFREDEAEEQQIKTGRLHENRILGIILKFYLDGDNTITTAEVESEYKKYFKEIARSTTSTYLNMLKKESMLYTERDGRLVNYLFYEDPPRTLTPFWFTRIFCIVPAYFHRALKFCNLYVNAEKYVLQYIDENGEKDYDMLLRNFKFITGIIILKILKNRGSKCINCQFSKREIYKKIEEMINVAINDRSDVLSNEISIDLIEKYSEILIFNKIKLEEKESIEKIIKEILSSADMFSKDLDFQIMVSTRRKESRLKYINSIAEENKSLTI
ncbi:MAG: hypothetical protein ACFFEY_16185 [Candidatus Thorarchaeota archaeon]